MLARMPCHGCNYITLLQFCAPSISTDLFYARFHCKTLRDRVMRGLGYGSHIERSVVSSCLTHPPPVS